LKRHPHDEAADRELSQFPAVRVVCREFRGKSRALVVEFDGKCRSIFYPQTPSDHRGVHRHLQDIRRVLAELGACGYGGRAF